MTQSRKPSSEMEVILKERENPFVHCRAEVFEKKSYFEKFFVKTDCIKFFEYYFERNLNYTNFVVEGTRGSGKTSCLWHLERLLSNGRKNLVIYNKIAFYPSLTYKYSNLFYTDDFIFLLPVYMELFHSFYKLNIKEIKKRKNRISSFFFFDSIHHPVKEKLNDLRKYVLSDISTLLKRISIDYSRVIFLVDDIDKFPFSNLTNISASLDENNITLSCPESLDVSFICAANSTVSSELSVILRKFTQKEAIIVNVNWDIGYLTEVIRRRIEDSVKKRLGDYLNDDTLFELYKGTNKNPRTILSVLNRLWDIAPERKMPILLSDINKVIREHKKMEILFGKDEANIENKFKLRFRPYWKRTLVARTKKDKGKALEELLCSLFESVKGLSISDKNIRTASEELDILIVNESKNPFLEKLGTPILVECKKWKHSVGAKEVNWFISKVKRRSIKVGIFIAWEGITGNEYKDANLEIKKALEDGIIVVVVTKDQLMEVYGPRDFLYTLKNCYYKVYKL